MHPEHVDHFEQVKEFVNESSGPCPEGRLVRTTRLERDLGITGDDAVEFLEAFVEKFNLDMSDFDMTKYFSGEGFMLDFYSIFKYIKGEKIYRYKKHMTIEYLANAIKAGKIE